MKTLITAAAIAGSLLISSAAMAAGVSSFAGPGNSAAANGGTVGLPDGQPNCQGQIRGNIHPGQYNGGKPPFSDDPTTNLSGIFLLGAVIGVLPPGYEDCWDYVQQNPLP